MNARTLSKDPYNIIVAGVGGQGNLMASRVIAGMFVLHNFSITIGETFGASQRGGSVMSHVRISKEQDWSPQIPKGKADIILSLEPAEAMSLLGEYGNATVRVISNSRPVYPVKVIAGESTYPSRADIVEQYVKFASAYHLIDASDEALKMGNPIFANIIMLGALIGTGMLPLTRDDFKTIIEYRLKKHLVDDNIRAFDIGMSLVNDAVR